MARADILAINARAALRTWGEVVHCDGAPIQAIVEREATRLDEYGTLSKKYVEIQVLESLAQGWGSSPVFTIDGKPYRLGPEVDRNGLARFEVIPK